MQINLNEQQANVLVNLIDLAVKSAGLQAAEAGIFFTKLIHDAIESEKPKDSVESVGTEQQ